MEEKVDGNLLRLSFLSRSPKLNRTKLAVEADVVDLHTRIDAKLVVAIKRRLFVGLRQTQVGILQFNNIVIQVTKAWELFLSATLHFPINIFLSFLLIELYAIFFSL